MKNKILIIDDEPDNLEYMARVLEKMNEDCDIYQANDGLMGYEVIQKENPDLVITDWQMPNTGIDLIKRMRKEPAYKYIPVIVYSGFIASSENLEIALEAGASDYVNKPIRPMELIARSHVLLSIYGDKNEDKYTGTNKTVFHLLRLELFNLYSQIKEIIPQISNRNTEFGPLKNDLETAIEHVINNPESLLSSIQHFLLTKSLFDNPEKESTTITEQLENIISKLDGLVKKKNLSIDNKFPAQKKGIINTEILKFTLWYILKESILKVSENSKIVLKEGKTKLKNRTNLSVVMNYRSFPKDIIAKIESNWNESKNSQAEEMKGCIGLLNSLKNLVEQNGGNIEFSSSKWKGIRFNVLIPIN